MSGWQRSIDNTKIGQRQPKEGAFTELKSASVAITGGTIDNALQGSVKFDHNVETLAADKTLTITDKIIQKLDLDGTDRNVLLPAENTATDLVFFIYNMGGEVGEDLYIQNDAAGALATVGYGQMGICTCDGTTWKAIAIASISEISALSLRIKEENTSALIIGQPVYVSGATGVAYPNAGLADCDHASKFRCKGLVAEAISQNTTGWIQTHGVLEGIDSTKGNAVNPNSEDWTAGNQLWLSTTAGGITNVRPTSGRSVKIGIALTVEGANNKILIDVFENPIQATAASGEDIILRMGDSAGANKVFYRDYGNNEVASIDSDGNAEFTGLKASIDPTDEHGVGDRGYYSGLVANNSFECIAYT